LQRLFLFLFTVRAFAVDLLRIRGAALDRRHSIRGVGRAHHMVRDAVRFNFRRVAGLADLELLTTVIS
jgi:hypothetical protein